MRLPACCRWRRSTDCSDVVTEHAPRLDYFEALRVLRDSTAVLLMGSRERHYTPSKVFPALVARRPVLRRDARRRATRRICCGGSAVRPRCAWSRTATMTTQPHVDAIAARAVGADRAALRMSPAPRSNRQRPRARRRRVRWPAGSRRSSTVPGMSRLTTSIAGGLRRVRSARDAPEARQPFRCDVGFAAAGLPVRASYRPIIIDAGANKGQWARQGDTVHFRQVPLHLIEPQTGLPAHASGVRLPREDPLEIHSTVVTRPGCTSVRMSSAHDGLERRARPARC